MKQRVRELFCAATGHDVAIPIRSVTAVVRGDLSSTLGICRRCGTFVALDYHRVLRWLRRNNVEICCPDCTTMNGPCTCERWTRGQPS